MNTDALLSKIRSRYKYSGGWIEPRRWLMFGTSTIAQRWGGYKSMIKVSCPYSRETIYTALIDLVKLRVRYEFTDDDIAVQDVHQIILEKIEQLNNGALPKYPLIVSGKLEVQVHAQPKSSLDKVKELAEHPSVSGNSVFMSEIATYLNKASCGNCRGNSKKVDMHEAWWDLHRGLQRVSSWGDRAVQNFLDGRELNYGNK